jgi:hypothetical protein
MKCIYNHAMVKYTATFTMHYNMFYSHIVKKLQHMLKTSIKKMLKRYQTTRCTSLILLRSQGDVHQSRNGPLNEQNK